MTSTQCHFDQRARERGLLPDVVDFVLTWGKEFRARGASHFTILTRLLPAELRDSRLAARALGWIVLVDGHDLITCYRRADAAHYLRRKPKHRRAEDSRNA
jgi:hypothetical protein